MRLSTFVACLYLGLPACKPVPQASAILLPAPETVDAQGPLKRYWQVPAFELVNQDAIAFNAAQMLGKVWVVDFFYTTCPGPCPALSSRLSDFHRAFEGDSRVGFLSISSNPSKDQPSVLKQYAQRFKADERWQFLTGREETVFLLANNGFKLSLTRTEGGAEPVTHSTRLALVDASGWVRGFYEGVGEESQDASTRLNADIKALLEEIK